MSNARIENDRPIILSNFDRRNTAFQISILRILTQRVVQKAIATLLIQSSASACGKNIESGIHDIFDDFSMHISEPIVSTIESVGQFFVIDSELM